MATAYIRRLDRVKNGTYGWEVHVARKDVRASRMFSDGRWGGRDEALAAAIAWRNDQHWYQMDASIAPRFHSVARARRATRSQFGPLRPARRGWASVEAPLRYERTELGDGRRGLFAFWMAAWTDRHGVRRERKFSVNFWGEDVAREKAEAAHRLHQYWALNGGPY